MKRIRYVVAMSLDGYIAGPHGEYDWILPDPDINFAELWAQFDTLLMGRRTYDVARTRLGEKAFSGVKVVVASRTLHASEHPNIAILPDLTPKALQDLRAHSAKDIWLMGGGDLFRTVLAMNEVDSVEVSVMPVLLGGGIKLLPDPATRARLHFTGHKIYRSGIVTLTYDVQK
jgi:dihydrofolate reductase